jgi:Ethanolamine utilization protein EutJ (predicted chaperonin)
MSEIRAWLEDAADKFMRNANETMTAFPPGVRDVRYEVEAEMSPVINTTRVDRPKRITFVAELENGNTIETTRG